MVFCLLAVGTALAQTIQVKGKVFDGTGETVPGVNVQIKGATTGTITDVDGNYTISVPNSKAVLVFSYIGFTSQEVKVANKTTINVTLKEDFQQLDEVVVVGYGQSRKGDLTGALTTMMPDAKDAMKASSIDNLLNGKVAGLVVNSASAMPGAASSITIRGASSLRGDNQPLYVIDNIPQASTGEFGASAMGGDDIQINQDPLSSLNPADIEDITILKDASSTAIYGSRGANGVILITTKKGKEGKAKVSASATFTVTNATRLLDMMSLAEHANYRNSRIANPNEYPFHIVGNEVRYNYNPSSYDPEDPTSYDIITERNWQKEIYHSAFSQNYAISVNGGSKALTYYVSANFKDINGTVKQTGLKQGDLRANLNADLSKNVTMKLVLAGSLRQNNMMAGGSVGGGSTTAVSRTALDYAPFELPEDDPNASDASMRTTVFSWLTDYVDIADDKTFNASLDLTWKICKNLSYSLRTGGNININERKRWYGLQLYQGMNDDGSLAISELNKSNYSVENLLMYNTKLSNWGRLDATVAMTYEDYGFLNQNMKGSRFESKDLRENGMHMAGVREIQQPIQKDYQLMSYLGRVNLNLFEKYLITASLRADGSSKFAKNNRWGYFPSASLAWRMEQEEFLKDLSWLNQLKLRVSYGVTGNQSIDPYSTFSMYGNASNLVYAKPDGTSQTVLAVTNLSNSSLKWEKTASWNVGIDFGILDSRLSGTIDIYNKKTTDLLIRRDLPGSAGFGFTYYNQGSLTNKGVEFTLNGHIIDTKDWKWNLSGNIGINRGEIGDLGSLPAEFGNLGSRVGYWGNSLGDLFGSGHVFLAGEAPGLFFGYRTNGIVQPNDIDPEKGVKYTKKDGSTGYYKRGTTTPAAGDVNYVDVNEDGEINEKDREIIGNPNPDFTYGIQTSLSWKSLSLSATFMGVQGRDILNTGIRFNSTPGQQANNITSEAYQNMWTAENPSNLYPSSNYRIPDKMILDRYVEDGSYFRCSDITLSYTLPKSLVRKVGLQNVSLFASVKNAFIITDYSGYDPEVNTFAFDGLRPGVDMNSYPTPRSYMMGLNVSF